MTNTRRKRLGRAAAIASVTFVAALGAAEAALRLFRPVAYRRPLAVADPAAGAADAWRARVHRRSALPGLAYELNPGSEADLASMHVRVNRFGLRGPEVAPARPQGVRRVAALGDSVTFGFGVAAEEAWPAVLERLLNESGAEAGERWQVLNFGVGGYSTRDEAIVLRAKALAFDPDVVVLGYYLNDPQTDPLQPLHQAFHQPLWWEHSHLLRGLVLARENRALESLGHGDEFRYWHAPEGRLWPSVPRAFDALRAALDARANGGARIPLVVATFPTWINFERWEQYPYTNLHQQVLHAAAERGFEGLDLVPAFDASGRTNAELMSDPDHPNAAGHAIAARALHDALRADGGRLLARPR